MAGCHKSGLNKLVAPLLALLQQASAINVNMAADDASSTILAAILIQNAYLIESSSNTVSSA